MCVCVCVCVLIFIFGCAGSHCSRCSEQGYSLVVMHGLLLVVASVAVEHGL